MAMQQDLYLLLGEIRSDVKYLREAREASNVRINNLEHYNREQVQKLEERIGVLENFKMRVAGVTVVFGSIAAFVAPAVRDFFLGG